MSFSPDFSKFLIISTDRQVKIFNCGSCKIFRQYDESLSMCSKTHSQAMEKKSTTKSSKLDSSIFSPFIVDEIEFGRRAAIEKDIDRSLSNPDASAMSSPSFNAIFDQSGTFLITSSLFGIKIINMYTNKLSKIIGTDDAGLRFMNMALYQGSCKSKFRKSIEILTSDNPAFNGQPTADPILFCTAYKKNRFYCISQTPPRWACM